MNFKDIIKPTKSKIVFIFLYIFLYIFLALSFPLYYGFSTDEPQKYGFPFIFKIEGCYYSRPPICISQFYPLLFIIDILIPLIIYVAIGILGYNANNSKRHKK